MVSIIGTAVVLAKNKIMVRDLCRVFSFNLFVLKERLILKPRLNVLRYMGGFSFKYNHT